MEERVFGGRYRVTGTLGHGGMASVYRAVDELLGREVAVKVFRIGPVDHGERARAEAEIQVLASLRSPSLVTLYDAALDDADGDSYLIMELVPGSDLATRLHEGPLDTVTTARVGAQIADGLAAAHAQGVVHRDVKPANVLLESDGVHVKLADFGIALLRDSARVTGTGTVMGTAAYIAPEQVMGQPITGKADVYALGLVLLETLSGKRPFPGSAVESATARLARSPEIDPHLPTAWRTLLHVLTATDPDERPTAAEAAERLRALGRDDVAPATQLLPGAPGAMTRAGAAGAGLAAAAAGAAAARADDASGATAAMGATAPMEQPDRADDATRVMPASRASRPDDVATTVLGAAAADAGAARAAGAGATPPRAPAAPSPARRDDEPRRRRWPIVLAVVVALLVIAGIVGAVVALGPGSAPTPTDSSTSTPRDEQPSTDASQPAQEPSRSEQEPAEPTQEPSEPTQPSGESSQVPVPTGLPEPTNPASNPVQSPQNGVGPASGAGPGGSGKGPGKSGNAPGHGG